MTLRYIPARTYAVAVASEKTNPEHAAMRSNPAARVAPSSCATSTPVAGM
jgi:hypothetical protein